MERVLPQPAFATTRPGARGITLKEKSGLGDGKRTKELYKLRQQSALFRRRRRFNSRNRT
ncbi:unnamed protein product [Oikopleura dioica]|uniref:Uncharacterized protein n=1 Tax=Oikopleura dioica TaxID=34765 RepID=E4X6Y7_OIKDI|nr:unnamed protein product [Oikopleura dioica]